MLIEPISPISSVNFASELALARDEQTRASVVALNEAQAVRPTSGVNPVLPPDQLLEPLRTRGFTEDQSRLVRFDRENTGNDERILNGPDTARPDRLTNDPSLERPATPLDFSEEPARDVSTDVTARASFEFASIDFTDEGGPALADTLGLDIDPAPGGTTTYAIPVAVTPIGVLGLNPASVPGTEATGEDASLQAGLEGEVVRERNFERQTALRIENERILDTYNDFAGAQLFANVSQQPASTDLGPSVVPQNLSETDAPVSEELQAPQEPETPIAPISQTTLSPTEQENFFGKPQATTIPNPQEFGGDVQTTGYLSPRQNEIRSSGPVNTERLLEFVQRNQVALINGLNFDYTIEQDLPALDDLGEASIGNARVFGATPLGEPERQDGQDFYVVDESPTSNIQAALSRLAMSEQIALMREADQQIRDAESLQARQSVTFQESDSLREIISGEPELEPSRYYFYA